MKEEECRKGALFVAGRGGQRKETAAVGFYGLAWETTETLFRISILRFRIVSPSSLASWTIVRYGLVQEAFETRVPFTMDC